MKVLQLAIEKQRYDLAAHVLVLSALRSLKNGGSPHAKKKAAQPKTVLHSSPR